MQESDLDQITAMEAQNFSVPWKRQDFAGYLDDPQALFLTASDVGGRIAGYIGCLFAADEGDITNVSVSGACRRRGIGSLLVRALLDEARKRGAVRIVLEVRQSNAAAIRLYEKYGFEQIGVRRGYYDHPREDALLMRAVIGPV